jgi:hypothetical protein
MGLSANQRIPVAVSMIDAHAGVLGLLATKQARAKGEPENQVSILITHFFAAHSERCYNFRLDQK